MCRYSLQLILGNIFLILFNTFYILKFCWHFQAAIFFAVVTYNLIEGYRFFHWNKLVLAGNAPGQVNQDMV